MNVLVWYKRDLRVADHPALAHAAGLGRVLPVYVVEPQQWHQPDASARHWGFVAESLAELRRHLAALGAPLVVRTGDAVEVLAALAARHGVTRIVSHQETGTQWSFARDRRVAAWARQAGIVWEELPQAGVRRGARDRAGWAGLRDGFMAAPVLPPPALSAVPGAEPGMIPSAAALRLAADRCPHRQAGGRTAGLALMDSFLASRGEGYLAAMSAPGTGERACSRLSPHLAWGTLSAREVDQSARARAEARPGGAWGGSLAGFRNRLAWRDHFLQRLEDVPDLEARALSAAAEALRPREPDAARLAAWAAGETGLPFVDACIRYLAATGWLNFRARAMLMAVASYQLWLDWRATAPVLARAFTDYEPGIHWSQAQMQSGVTGINAPRIYNPVKQGQDHDPTGAFTRAWVPELAAVPDIWLQEPWKWPGARGLLGRRYPEPVVDPEAAARAARAAIGVLRRAPEARDEAEVIEARHGSPGATDARFRRDAPGGRRARPAKPGQLSFGF